MSLTGSYKFDRVLSGCIVMQKGFMSNETEPFVSSLSAPVVTGEFAVLANDAEYQGGNSTIWR